MVLSQVVYIAVVTRMHIWSYVQVMRTCIRLYMKVRFWVI